MKFGLNTSPRGLMSTRDAYLTIAQLADRMGYDFLSVSDHVVVPNTIESTYPYSEGGTWTTATPSGFSLEQLTTMAVLVGATEQIKLLSSVTVVPHRPALLTAKILSSMDVLSKGRIILGVGAGWLREEFEALQTDPYDARGQVTDEYIAAFKELWANPTPEFDGEFVRFKDILFEPKPHDGQSIPIWVGGESNPALRRTARLGDAWYPGSGNPKHRLDTPERLAGGIAQLHQAAEKVGRDPGSIDIAFVNFTPVSFTPVPGHDTSRALFSGTAQEMIDDANALRALGVSHVNLSFPANDLTEMAETVQRFSEDVFAHARTG